MSNQIETTLQDAVERCLEGGGRIHDKNQPQCGYDYKELKVAKAIGRVLFTPGDFKGAWIYEPPRKSAFQKWFGGEGIDNYDTFEMCAAKGWNAAIDRITGDPQITLTPSEANKIEALKEP